MTSSWARWSLKSPAFGLFSQLFVQAEIKEHIKAPVYWLCEGNPPVTVTSGFPSQTVSDAENVSIRWRHHVPPAVAQYTWCTFLLLLWIGRLLSNYHPLIFFILPALLLLSSLLLPYRLCYCSRHITIVVVIIIHDNEHPWQRVPPRKEIIFDSISILGWYVRQLHALTTFRGFMR